MKIIAASITTVGIISLIFQDELWIKIAAAIVSLGVLQKYRASDKLALVPSSATDLRQHYADLIAEYVHAMRASNGNDPDFPDAAKLEGFGESFEQKFLDLFGDQSEYHQYGGAVFRTHELYCKFAEAAAAYALLKPGKKGAPDAVPEEEAIQRVMAEERKREKPLTFDVYSNMISPMERYARARSRTASTDYEQVRIPRSLLAMVSDASETSKLYAAAAQNASTDTAQEDAIADAVAGMPEIAVLPDDAGDVAQNASAGKQDSATAESPKRKTVCPEELALATMLYYRYEYKNKQDATGKCTEFYPISVRETGAYLTHGDQAKIINKLKENAQLLIYNEFYFVDQPKQERQIMVALKKKVVDDFRACNKDDATGDTYFMIKVDKPRSIVDEIRTESRKALREHYLLVSYLTRKKNSENYIPWRGNEHELLALLQKILGVRLDDIGRNGCKNMRSKAQAPFDRITDPGSCILKLCMAAHLLDLNLTDGKDHKVAPKDLKLSLESDAHDAHTVFTKLEKVWTKVFATGMTMSYGWKPKEKVFRCTLKPTRLDAHTPSR